MNKRFLLIVSLLALLLLALPVIAQDEGEIPTVEVIPVSGTFSYTWELLHMVATDGVMVEHAREDEI